MAQNKLIDLNDYLFAQLERFDDEDLTPEQTAIEIEKSKAIVAVSGQIIKNARLVLDANKLIAGGHVKSLPEHLGAEPRKLS